MSFYAAATMLLLLCRQQPASSRFYRSGLPRTLPLLPSFLLAFTDKPEEGARAARPEELPVCSCALCSAPSRRVCGLRRQSRRLSRLSSSCQMMHQWSIGCFLAWSLLRRLCCSGQCSSFYGLTGLEHTFTAFTHYGLLCSKRGHGRVYQLAVFSLFFNALLHLGAD